MNRALATRPAIVSGEGTWVSWLGLLLVLLLLLVDIRPAGVVQI